MFFLEFNSPHDLMCVVYIDVVFRFILINGCLLGQGLAVEVAMLQLHYGQQINLVAVLPLRKNSKNGQVRLDQIFPSFSLREQPIALVEERLVQTLGTFLSQSQIWEKPQDVYVLYIAISCCVDSQCVASIDNILQFWLIAIIVKSYATVLQYNLKNRGTNVW